MKETGCIIPGRILMFFAAKQAIFWRAERSAQTDEGDHGSIRHRQL